MADDARILIAQHAETARLMGVDFMPIGRVPEGLIDESVEVEPVSVAIESAGHGQSEFKPALKSATEPSSSAASKSMNTDIEPIAAKVLRTSYAKVKDQQGQLDALRAKYELESPHQHSGSSHTSVVFGEGDACADLMFIGDAPGEEEDIAGRPFVGRAGQLLEKMIVAMGFTRESVYICNVLKTRPDGNAAAGSFEMGLCSPYVTEQIRIIEPKVIVTLGLPVSQLILGSNKPMRAMRGHWQDYSIEDDGGSVHAQVMPTYHPAYLLRSYTQENRQAVWSDLQQVVSRLKAEE